MPFGYAFTHAHRYSGVMAGADTHLELVTELRGGAEFHMHACVSVCKRGVWGIPSWSFSSAGGCVHFQIYLFLFPPFISEDSWREPQASEKIKAGHGRDSMLTVSPKRIELNLD